MSRNYDRAGSRGDPAATLRARFDRAPVAELGELERALRCSGRTVVRVLKKLGYRSSYSHAGRFYTLDDIPRFDAHGLWFYEDAGFSVHGTLRATVERLVREAEAGHSHEELRSLLRLRVQDTLRSLTEARRIGRELVESVYVYLAPDPKAARAQLAKRRALGPPVATATPVLPLDLARVIDVLVLVIQRPAATAAQIAATLRGRSISVTDAQVEDVFTHYALGKKRARSRSRRSRR